MTAYRSRADWNARPRRGSTAFPGGRPLGVACHWPGTTTMFTGKSEAAIASALRGWQNYHMDDRGWTDIAYSVGIDPAGRVWQLRGVDVRSAANGGTQANADYVAALWVLGVGEDPTAAQIQAFRDWRTTRLLKAHPGAKAVKTHNDVRPAPTACPGPDVTKLVRSGALTRAAAPEEENPLAGIDKADAKLIGEAVRDALLGADVIPNHRAREGGQTGTAGTLTIPTALGYALDALRDLQDAAAVPEGTPPA